MPFVIVQTRGFISEVSDEGENCCKGRLIAYALKHINRKTNMVVFYPEGERPDWIPPDAKEYLDDEG